MMVLLAVAAISLCLGIVIGTEFPLSGPRRIHGRGDKPSTPRPPAPSPMRPMIRSTIMPEVTISTPMPKGAAVPRKA